MSKGVEQWKREAVLFGLEFKTQAQSGWWDRKTSWDLHVKLRSSDLNLASSMEQPKTLSRNHMTWARLPKRLWQRYAWLTRIFKCSFKMYLSVYGTREKKKTWLGTVSIVLQTFYLNSHLSQQPVLCPHVGTSKSQWELPKPKEG